MAPAARGAMIYICYGVTKSASTFLYQLTEEILVVSGRSCGRIRQPGSAKLENYFDRISPAFLDRIAAAARGRDVVLKTHGPLDPGVGERIASGAVKASASIRDPREMAMSMADNGARARKLGLLPFAEIHTPADAIHSLDVQMDYFAAWSSVPGVELFTYNEICFSTEAAIRRVAAHLGLTVNAAAVLTPFRDGSIIGQFNVGKPQRYREMDVPTQALFLERYADLYARFDFDAAVPEAPPPALKPRGALGHRIESTRRYLRRAFLTRSIGTVSPY